MNVVGVTRRVLDCVVAELTLPPCTDCTLAGQPAIDRCCDKSPDCGGMITAHVVSLFDANHNGIRVAPRATPCNRGAVGAQVQVTLARCLPTIDDHGVPPDCDTLVEYAAMFDRDLTELWRALACCDDVTSVVGVDVQQPPTGGCVVAVATVNVTL